MDLYHQSARTANESLFHHGAGFQGNMPLHLTFVNGDAAQNVLPLYEEGVAAVDGSITQNEILRFCDDVFPFLKSIRIYEHGVSADAEVSRHFLEHRYAKHIHCQKETVLDLEAQRFCQSDSQLYRGPTANFQLTLLRNGDLVVPSYQDSGGFVLMGNIRHTPVDAIWYGDRYNAYRLATLDGMINALSRYEETALKRQAAVFQQCVDVEGQLDAVLKKMKPTEAQLPVEYHRYATYRNAYSNKGWFNRLERKQVPDMHSSREQNYILYQQGEHFQGNMPVHLEISITEGCNIKCRMCNLSQLSPDHYASLARKRIDFEKVYRKLADEVFPYIRSISFAVGGEPTIHPDLPEMIRLAGLSGVYVQLTTNGLKLRDDKIASMCVQHVDNLTISIDGATKGTFEAVRQGAKWERVIDGIRKIISMRSQNPQSRLKLTVNYTLMQDNIEEFPQMIRLAHELEVSKIVGQHLLIPSEEMKSQSLFTTPERCNRYVKIAEELASQLGIELQIPDYFATGEKREVPEPMPELKTDIVPAFSSPEGAPPHCKLLNYSIVVISDGSVMPCSHPDANHAFRMGRISEQSFREIWYGKRFQGLRNVSNGTVPEPCANCAMLGKTTGGLPVQNNNPVHTVQTISEATPYTSRRFMIQRLRFIARLTYQTERMEHHSDTLQTLLFHAQKHLVNLQMVKKYLSGARTFIKKKIETILVFRSVDTAVKQNPEPE